MNILYTFNDNTFLQININWLWVHFKVHLNFFYSEPFGFVLHKKIMILLAFSINSSFYESLSIYCTYCRPHKRWHFIFRRHLCHLLRRPPRHIISFFQKLSKNASRDWLLFFTTRHLWRAIFQLPSGNVIPLGCLWPIFL